MSGAGAAGVFFRSAAYRLPGLLLLALAVPVVARLPVFNTALLIAGFLYLLLLARWSCAWLVVLPVVCVAVDLTSWTGRALFNELDWLFLLTISSGFLFRRGDFHAFSPHWWSWPALLYVLLLVFGLGRWGVFVDPPGAVYQNFYYHVDYGYKLAKGALWGLLLAPMWLAHYRSNPDRAVNTLVAGCVTAALVLCVIILWERGTLAVLLAGKAWYHIVNSFLDFGGSYRVTGIFSDMHTGGEVLDGMIVLLLPPTLYGIVHWRQPAARVAAGFAAAALCYITLVGFTRTTYVAVAAAIVLYFAWEALLRRHRLHLTGAGFVRVAFALVLAGTAATKAFAAAGSYGIACFVGIQCLAYLAWRLRESAGRNTILLLIPVACALVAGAAWAHLTSRWVEPSSGTAAALALLLAASGIATGYAAAGIAMWKETSRVLALSGLVVGSAALAFGLGGSQIEGRIKTLNRDMELRLDHWRNVIASGDGSPAANWLGNGVGTFPRNYVAAFPETFSYVGSFSVNRQASHLLRLGPGHDLAFAQRVSIEPGRDYVARIELRAAARARLDFYICARNVLFASNFARNCSQARLRIEDTKGEFITELVQLPSGRVGRGGWQRWPSVFYVKSERRGNPIEIGSLDLFGAGQAGLRNPDFRAGLDHWFFYCDFAHLPWHIKNTGLHVWYETGWLGLAAFVAALILAVLRAAFAGRSEPLLPALATALVALALVGLFGTPMDSARVGWLFFFALFAILLLPEPAVANERAASVDRRRAGARVADRRVT